MTPVTTLLSSLPGHPDGQGCFVGATALDPRSRLAESPLLSGAVLSVGGAGPDFQPVRGAAAGTLHVFEGPDAGFGAALRAGRHTHRQEHRSGPVPARRGRLTSARRARGLRGWPGRDLGRCSRNGTFVDGTPVTEPTMLDQRRRGADRREQAALDTRAAAPARGHADTRGVSGVRPGLRADPGDPAGRGGSAGQEPGARNAATMVLSVIVGLASGAVMAAATHQKALLLVSIIGPLARSRYTRSRASSAGSARAP